MSTKTKKNIGLLYLFLFQKSPIELKTSKVYLGSYYNKIDCTVYLLLKLCVTLSF
jgi:hypothetical protein